MRLEPGSLVSTADGGVVELVDVIIDEAPQRVSHVALAPVQLGALAHLVPISGLCESLGVLGCVYRTDELAYLPAVETDLLLDDRGRLPAGTINVGRRVVDVVGRPLGALRALEVSGGGVIVRLHVTSRHLFRSDWTIDIAAVVRFGTEEIALDPRITEQRSHGRFGRSPTMKGRAPCR